MGREDLEAANCVVDSEDYLLGFDSIIAYKTQIEQELMICSCLV